MNVEIRLGRVFRVSTSDDNTLVPISVLLYIVTALASNHGSHYKGYLYGCLIRESDSLNRGVLGCVYLLRRPDSFAETPFLRVEPPLMETVLHAVKLERKVEQADTV